MDNNNSIPYGSISWDNEDTFPTTNQQREAQRIPPLRPPISTGSNGLRYSLRGPHFPPPQQRTDGVGISRNLELSNRLQQAETTHSNFQQPSSSSTSSPPYERYFSLRPSRSTSHVHMHSTESQSPNSINSSIEGEAYATLYANPSPGSSSNNPGMASVSENPNFSATSIYTENACNNNIEMTRGLTSAGSYERIHASRTKRKSDEGQDGPTSKQFLSEERMAARMHNLRISSDHNYPVNIMQRFMDSFTANQASGSSESQIDDDDDEFENADETQRRTDNLPVFVLSSHVKDAVAKPDPIIPEAIYRQLSKPCLAVVPWKGPDERFSFSTQSKPEDQDKNENETSSSSSSSCTSLIMESMPETEHFQDKGIHHVEIVGECSTFNFEDDDMEL
ncbi:hypothetical protein ACROYT_G010605 [Oculina patagonica]